jgi:hypothetical protein
MTYITQSPDTAIAAELYLFDLWRSQTPTQRASQVNHNTLETRETAWYIAKTTLVSQSKTKQINLFLKKVLDDSLIEYLDIPGDMTMTGVMEEILVITNILESLEIPYLVGGSVASGIWGEIRYTQDIDLVVDLKKDQIDSLINVCSPRFYLSKVAIEEAIYLGNSFNLIDNHTGWKIDLFILTADPFQQNRFQRKKSVSLDETGKTFNVSSVEDTILQKLIWSGMGQRQSGQQWRDILGVIKLQQPVIDISYLRGWANILKVSADLEQALTESKLK